MVSPSSKPKSFAWSRRSKTASTPPSSDSEPYMVTPLAFGLTQWSIDSRISLAPACHCLFGSQPEWQRDLTFTWPMLRRPLSRRALGDLAADVRTLSHHESPSTRTLLTVRPNLRVPSDNAVNDAFPTINETSIKNNAILNLCPDNLYVAAYRRVGAKIGPRADIRIFTNYHRAPNGGAVWDIGPLTNFTPPTVRTASFNFAFDGYFGSL